jgi:hypothetical protein
MIICPYCGTRYQTFQPNCQNCGGPLLEKTEEMTRALSSEELPVPPAAPRQISNQYVWKLLATDGWWITALVLGLIGFIFSIIGSALVLGIVTVFVGIIFLPLGLALLGAGIYIFIWRYQKALKVVYVLRDGDATTGTISQVQEDLSVMINERHPWIIEYEYQVNGQPYTGKVTTLHQPAQQAGNMARILYLATEPQLSSIYPHP